MPGHTVSVVLHVVEVNPPLPPVLLQQVALGAAQVDPAALWQAEGWEGCICRPGTATGSPSPLARLRSPPDPQPGRTSSQFCSSFTQNLARWKLLLSVRSGGEGSGSVPSLLHPPSAATPDPLMPMPAPSQPGTFAAAGSFLFTRHRALTVADDGGPCPAVVDAAHGLVALRTSRVLGVAGKHSAGGGGISGVPTVG